MAGIGDEIYKAWRRLEKGPDETDILARGIAEGLRYISEFLKVEPERPLPPDPIPQPAAPDFNDPKEWGRYVRGQGLHCVTCQATIVNRADAEDCPACGEDRCLYHEGVDAGWHAAAKLIAEAAQGD